MTDIIPGRKWFDSMGNLTECGKIAFQAFIDCTKKRYSSYIPFFTDARYWDMFLEMYEQGELNVSEFIANHLALEFFDEPF